MKIIKNKNKIIIISAVFVLAFVISFCFFYFNKESVINRTCKITLPENYEIEEYSKKGRYFSTKIRISDEDAAEIQKQLENENYQKVALEDQRGTHEEYTTPWWDLKKSGRTKCYRKFDDIYFLYFIRIMPTVTTVYLHNLHDEDTLLYIYYSN